MEEPTPQRSENESNDCSISSKGSEDDTITEDKVTLTNSNAGTQNDAATIHESFAQKAACPLESVDASYPNKVGAGQEYHDIVSEAERQTYSEKRKFWEDISRKRESYQRSESEVSRTSQLTINESDSEYLQNVVSEEEATEAISVRSETMEDMNVPDISECSVAEKAHYFEEQIQKELAKVPPKVLQQQESLKEKDNKSIKAIRSTDQLMDYSEKKVAESIREKQMEESLEYESAPSAKEKEREEKEAEDDYSKEKEQDESRQAEKDVEELGGQAMMEICKEMLSKERDSAFFEAERIGREMAEARVGEILEETVERVETRPVVVKEIEVSEEIARKKVSTREEKKVTVTKENKGEERMDLFGEKKTDDVSKVPKKTTKPTTVEDQARETEELVRRKETVPVREVESDTMARKASLEKDIEIMETASEDKGGAKLFQDVPVERHEVVTTREEAEIVEKPIGTRVVKEETTIIYKVQEDGSLVQEKVLKSVEIQGGQGQTVIQVPEVDLPMDSSLDIKKRLEDLLDSQKRMSEEVEIVSEKADLPFENVVESEIKQIKKESRIPVFTAKADKDRVQKEVKSKTVTEVKQVIGKLEADKDSTSSEVVDVTSPTKKKEFESRIPKRILDTSKQLEKETKKDSHGKTESEVYTVTEKKSTEEVRSKQYQERSTTKKSETQTFTKTFADPQEAFQIFEDMGAAKEKEFSTITSKVDHKASSKVEKKEVISSEISTGADKIITHEEKEHVERKKSSETKTTKESPIETTKEEKSETEELDRTAVQKMSMNLSAGKQVIDASASESRAESKKEGSLKSVEDREGITTQESGTSRIKESDVEVAVKIKKDDSEKIGEKGTAETDKVSDIPTAEDDLGTVEKLVQGETHKETVESFNVTQFVPREKDKDETLVKTKEEHVESKARPETLEERQQQTAKELHARKVAENLIDSIENMIQQIEFDETSTQSSAVAAYGHDKQYLDRLILGSMEADHEKLADDLTRKFEHIMKKSSLDDPSIDTSRSDYMTESTRLRSSIHEEGFERGSMRDSISISEDLTKDETSSPHDKEESFALSSLRGRLPDRDITISPSSISDQIELEETMDIDTNELEDTSKPLSSLQTDKSGARLDTSQKDVFGLSLSKDKVMSELSGARVVAICPPAGETGTGESQSRQDSMDVPSLELDEHKFSDEIAKDAGYLHKSAAVDSLEKIYQDRDITVSPSTVSEDTNVDYSLVHEQYPGQTQEHELSGRRADSFEIDSPPLVSPRSKVQGLEIKPVTWMIGDEKIEISETLQPSQVFNQELEEYESTMRQQDRLPSREGSTDFEQDTGTKSSEDTSVIESSVKEAIGEDATVPIKTTKFTVIPVNEQEFESELIENKLEISCQELVDALHRESLAKTPTEDLMNLAREGALDAKDTTTDSSVAGDMSTSTSEIQTTTCTELAETDSKKREIVEELTPKDTPKVTVETVDKPKTIEPSSQEELSLEEKVEEAAGAPYWETRKTERVDDVSKEKTEACPIKVRQPVEELVLEEKVGEVAAAGPERETHKSVDEVLKEWGDPYLTKVKPTMEEYKRQAEKTGAEKYEILMSGIDEHPPSGVDLSARYAISVLGQVVKKEIAEVKESLEAAKQDLIEELSENSENVIQIKDSPSEFQFKLQPESIPNDLPFLYKPPSQEQIPAEREPETLRRESPITVKFDMEDTPEQKWGTIPRLYTPKKKTIPSELPDDLDETGEVQYGATSDTEKSERSERETATTVHDDLKEEEDWSHSPVPASRSSSDVDYKDDSFSLEPPQPAPRRRHRPARSSRKVTSESEADLGSSSGDSSNYQSCDYESSSRPSSSDVEALQSAGIQSGTASEYETAMMSIEQSGGSKATSQEYHTAASTLSSRESMKSLNSLSSGHLGSIDSTSELSETLVPSETDMDREEIDENLEGILDEEQIEQSDSSGSDMPIDETVDKIDSNIPCRMKRSSEMIFQQVVDDNALETEGPEEVVERDSKGVDSSTSAFVVTPGALQSVDIMTSRVTEDGVQSVCTQVISTQVTTTIETKELPADSRSEAAEGDTSMEVTEETMGITDTATESTKEEEEGKAAEADTTSESLDSTMPRSVHSMLQQASMSTSSASGVSFDTVIEKEKSDRHSPDSDSFELVDKPDIIDDFVVIEEVGREAEEYDSEGKSIRISSLPPANGKNYDRDLENLITDKKEDPQISSSQKSRNNELFDFESEESPPQASNEDQYSQSYYFEEGFEGQKKWIEMQYRQDITRVCDVDYPRGPLEDIEEEEITEFRAGRSRFGSLGSHKESIGSASSVRGSFGSTPEFDVLSSMKYTPKRPNHDNVSLSSLQEFEQLENTVAAENSKSLQCGSQDSINNGSLPRRIGRSGHDDDISLSSLKDFEGLEKACREAHLIELKAREEEDLLEHESPENRYKLEALARAKAASGLVGSTNLSDDYETRIKEIDEIIRIAQSNIEKIDHQDDTTEDISQIEITDMEKVGSQAGGQLASAEVEDVQPSKETNVMETSTDSLELEENGDKKHHPLCRSSDSLEMKTTLDFPSLSSDSLNNVRDAKDAQLDNPEQYSTVRRISSDSLDIQLHEQQDVESHVESNSNYSERATSETSIRQTSSMDTNIAKNGETKALPPDSGT